MKLRDLIIAGVVIVILIMGTIIIANNDGEKSQSGIQKQETINTLEIASVEDKFKTATEACKKRYIEYGYKDFEIYFSTEFINNNIEGASIELVTDIKAKDYTGIKIYDTIGYEIKEIPMAEIENAKIETSSEILQNKNYLMRIYNDENGYSYYYIVKFDRIGNPEMRKLFYTVGEESAAIEIDMDLEATEEVIN